MNVIYLFSSINIFFILQMFIHYICNVNNFNQWLSQKWYRIVIDTTKILPFAVYTNVNSNTTFKKVVYNVYEEYVMPNFGYISV